MSEIRPIRTVRDALGWACSLLPEGSPPWRRMEIDRLLAHVLGVPRHEIYLSPDRTLSPEETESFRGLWSDRLEGQPLQLLLGEIEFISLDFRVRPGVFIPRPETECLVEAVAGECRSRGGFWIDVGTGTGVIALTLAAAAQSSTLIATDISREALNLARENARRHSLQARVRFVLCDLLGAFGETGWAEGVVSNPPYIPVGEMDDLPAEVRNHDPHPALFGGTDGLDILRRLVGESGRVLRRGGTLALEVGEGQADEVRSLLERDPSWGSVSILNDLSARPRVVRAIRSAC